METKGFIWAGLSVEDMPAQVAFYRDVLGLQLLRQGEGWAHLDAGGGALLELFSGGKASQQPKQSAQQPLILGLRVADLERAVSELRDKGVKFIGEIGEFEGDRWAHFSDPEGNRLEIKEVTEKGFDSI